MGAVDSTTMQLLGSTLNDKISLYVMNPIMQMFLCGFLGEFVEPNSSGQVTLNDGTHPAQTTTAAAYDWWYGFVRAVILDFDLTVSGVELTVDGQ